MPTCSQAKIITNIESDLNKRVYNLSNETRVRGGRNSLQALYFCSNPSDDQSTNTTKLPLIYKDLLQNKSTIPINFLYNSPLRNRTLSPAKRRSSLEYATENTHSSSSSCSQTPPRRHSTDDYQDIIVPQNRKNSLTSFTNLPKLALEIENNANNTKRLLALASIRPSKTFHKEITTEEAEILKKYYEIIKPRVSFGSNDNQIERDTNVADSQHNQIPILYDLAKINLENYKNLEQFLNDNKEKLINGEYTIAYNPPGHSGFVLEHKLKDKILKFPSNTHDIFVALILAKNSNKNVRLNEANILRSLSWNDKDTILSFSNKTSISSSPLKNNLKNKKLSIDGITQSLSFSDVSLESVRSLSSLVASIASPQLVKTVFDNSIDLSSLPGGINFEMPAYDDIDFDSDIKYTYNGQSYDAQVSTKGKLKNSTVKKIKEKLSTTRVMWFSKPPERKPLSIVFECSSGVDVSHEEIIESINECLTSTNGQVTQVEFVPRSVHLSSVYIDNLWIVTLNNKDSKYFLISHEFFINGQKINAKSYDEFINMEYEKFIRSEKYRQLLKSHEKAMKQQQKQNKQK